MAEMRKTLAEVRSLAPESKFSAVGLVTELKEKRDRNDKAYWIITLMDKSGSVDAHIWGNAQWWDYRNGPAARTEVREPSESPLVEALKGQSIGVTGQTSEFKGKVQYSFNQIFLVDQNDETYRPSNFIRAAGVAIDKLQADFRELLDNCGGEAGEFLRFVFEPDGACWEAFQTLPAAVSHHHAYLHGLLEHTLGVARLARSMALSYQGLPVAPDVDVVTAGAYLHDLGKIDTYLLTPAPAMTLDGTVTDHIARGYARFCVLAEQFGLSPLTRTLLGHIVLSHHGQKEYGSPVLPATPEALVVAAADNLDFQLNCWHQAVELLDGGDDPDRAISDFDFSTQRRFWKWRPFSEVE